MKTTTLLAAVLFSVLSSKAEALISSEESTNRIVVLEGQALIITAIRASSPSSEFSHYFAKPTGIHGRIVANGTTNDVPLACNIPQTFALAGPAEIFFWRTYWDEPKSALICYKTVQSEAIKTVYIPLPESIGITNTARIEVPVGKTLKFFRPFWYVTEHDWDSIQVIIEAGSAPSARIPIIGNEEITGPATIAIEHQRYGPSDTNAKVISYSFTEDFLVMPELGLLQGPTGSFEIAVQKSVDLTNWFPVVVHNTSSDQKAFYRLKIGK